MATAGHDSSAQLPLSSGSSPHPPTVWLNGDVLACACPGCQAPMSIRLWLMVADCWRCGMSIELSEEQERVARRLLEEREQPAPATAPAPTAEPAQPQAKLAPAPAKPKPAPPAPAPKPAATVPPPPPPAPVVRRQRIGPREEPRSAPAGPIMAPPVEGAASMWDVLGDIPAWLISGLFHLLLMLLLALWNISPDQETPRLVLALDFGPQETDGGRPDKDVAPEVDPVIETGAEQSPEPEPNESEQSQEQQLVDGELSPADDDPGGLRPQLSNVVAAVSSPHAPRMFEGRDPRIRAQVVAREGGSTQTEEAVLAGLQWIVRHQHPDGNWTLHRFHEVEGCDGRCDGQGQVISDTGATALALLPLLGAGQSHRFGLYRQNVERGLHWLVENQKDDGDLRGAGQGRMYAHGQAAIVLCEAYALTEDRWLKQPAQRAIDFIVSAQHSAGGWRYEPGEPGDTSVVGWQLMALRSARMAGLEVPDETFERAERFLDEVQAGPLGGQYRYMRDQSPTPTMTAEGLLCRQYLGWPKDHAGLREGVTYLVDTSLPSSAAPDIYRWYYATQVMHHVGGRPWRKWNEAMRRTLLEMRSTEGHEAGSWDPRGGMPGEHDTRSGGRLFMTSLAVCTLEVYYRHLPLYRGIELESK